MESKVKEYQDMYRQFEVVYERVLKVEEPISDIKDEIEQLKRQQDKVDYNNPDVVVDYMDIYINEAIVKEKSNIQKEVDDRMVEITNPSSKAIKNFNKTVKWLSRAKTENYLRSSNIDFEQYINVRKAENAAQFTALTIINIVFSFVFRFNFLRFLPKVLRCIAGAIFWTIFLIPKVFEKVYSKYLILFEEKFEENFSKLSVDQQEIIREQFIKDYISETLISVAVVITVMIVVNIIVYMLARYFAKKYLSDNKAVCLALIDPNGLKQKMYDASVATYMETTVADWNEEIELVRKNRVVESTRGDSLISLVKNNLCEKYQLLEEKISNYSQKIEEIRKQAEQNNSELQALIPKLKEKEIEVDRLVADSNHNNAVLSPYVSAGYSQYTTLGVKELLYFKHNYKPMLICYDDDTSKDGERFRKNAAKLVELFMSGFYQENYHAYINMWLVDFEGLYFPESRTKGLMKVVRTQQGLQQMFDELKATREMVDSLADGRINNINPDRLSRRENPVKYNIVYFVGIDFTTIDREATQLFVGGENFGFLPIVFMKKSVAQEMLSDDTSSRAFARVVEKMRDNSQIYEFEGLVSEFEYDVVVSNQKRLLDERMCVNKIMSLEEFVMTAESENGMDILNVLYLDTYQLSKEIYEAVEDMDYVKLFTINGDVPKFVTKDVIKLY